MNGKKRNVEATVTAVVFAALLAAFFLAAVFSPAKELSQSERRKLAQFPAFTGKTVLSAAFMGKFETFAQDQFPLRESFRGLKSQLLYRVFRLSDKNGLYVVDKSLAKFTSASESGLLSGKAKLERVIAQYLGESNVYFALIPTKHDYFSAQSPRPGLTYEAAREIYAGLAGARFIDLTRALSQSDYYKTDLHWDQARLMNVVKLLGEEMGFTPPAGLVEETLGSFAGAYYGQAALPLEKDTLTLLTGGALDGLIVHSLNEKTLALEPAPLYEREALSGMDAYDVFLGGAVPLVVIENPAGPLGRELVLFRDSFSSSLAPLLAAGYSKVTLIDLRYMASALLEDYVDFAGADALFLYSAEILNNSGVLLVN